MMTSTTTPAMLAPSDADADADAGAVQAGYAGAHAARDGGRVLALYAADAISHTLAPPLQQGPDTAYRTPEGLAAWFGTFDGPMVIDNRDPVVTLDGGVAFVHTLTRMSAVPLAGSWPSYPE